jgi:hypothetical protein
MREMMMIHACMWTSTDIMIIKIVDADHKNGAPKCQ